MMFQFTIQRQHLITEKLQMVHFHFESTLSNGKIVWFFFITYGFSVLQKVLLLY